MMLSNSAVSCCWIQFLQMGKLGSWRGVLICCGVWGWSELRRSVTRFHGGRCQERLFIPVILVRFFKPSTVGIWGAVRPGRFVCYLTEQCSANVQSRRFAQKSRAGATLALDCRAWEQLRLAMILAFGYKSGCLC